MLVRTLFILFVFVIPTSLSAGNDPADRRVEKRVQKIWDKRDLKYISSPYTIGSDPEGEFLRIEYEEDMLGYVYKGKVYTCGLNGCERPDLLTDKREYFQFFLILNPEGVVLHTEITEYAATHGFEVSSPGWLKQFKGKNSEDVFHYGHEIDAITGATRSGQNMTAEVNLILNNFRKVKK